MRQIGGGIAVLGRFCWWLVAYPGSVLEGSNPGETTCRSGWDQAAQNGKRGGGVRIFICIHNPVLQLRVVETNGFSLRL